MRGRLGGKKTWKLTFSAEGRFENNPGFRSASQAICYVVWRPPERRRVCDKVYVLSLSPIERPLTDPQTSEIDSKLPM